MSKAHKQLGMNKSTAQNRLVKDLLFKFAVESGHKCHQCGEELTRDTFSIEHKTPWLDSEDPVKLFFDLDNIAFSHLVCNIKASRTTTKYEKIVHGTPTAYVRFKCRCEVCRNWNNTEKRRQYNKEKRRTRYLKYEKK